MMKNPVNAFEKLLKQRSVRDTVFGEFNVLILKNSINICHTTFNKVIQDSHPENALIKYLQ